MLMAGLAAACSSGGSGGSSGPGESLVGRCDATLEGQRDGEVYATTAEFLIVQSGLTVTGTWTTADGREGELSGVIDVLTRTLTFTMTQTVPCDATFTGQALVAADNTASGSFSGDSCLGTETVNFVIDSCVEEPAK